MNFGIIVLCIVLSGAFLSYIAFYLILRRNLKKSEGNIMEIFHLKVSKIPALIEVMRPSIVDEKAFETMTKLHTESIIQAYDSVYDLLEHNARVHNEFLFLLKLSVHMPDLNTQPYFLYLRDFIMRYDRDMQARFTNYNQAVENWNLFITCKNFTLLGYFLPGTAKMHI